MLEYLRALESCEGAELLISETAHGKIIESIIYAAKQKRVKITYADKQTLSQVDSSSRHQGVLLKITSAKSLTREDDFLEEVFSKNGVLILLDQMTDPHNIGSIIRTTEALGGNGVVLPKTHSCEINPTVVKASAGATAHLKILSISNIAQFLTKVKEMGFWIVGTSADGDTDPEELKNVRPAIIIIGSEGSGMRRLTNERCDYFVRIPLQGNISSLNASVAAGIILYEMLRP